VTGSQDDWLDADTRARRVRQDRAAWLACGLVWALVFAIAARGA